MKRVILPVYLKRFLLLMFSGILFVIILCLLIIGVGKSEDGLNISVPQFLIKSKDIILKKDSSNTKIKVYISKKSQVEDINLEEYVAGVVAAEVPVEFSPEALKAQAVASRTYALAHMEAFGGHKYKSNTGADVSDTTQCQVYIDKDTALKTWPESKRSEYWKKIEDAVQDTSGEILTYKGKLVMEPYYFSVSSGKTEDSEDVFSDTVPYLKSVSSTGEEDAPKYKSTVKMSNLEFINKINFKYKQCGLSLNNLKNEVQIRNKNKGGSIKEVKLGNVTISGTEFRNIMGLNSANFNIIFNNNVVEISCNGYGHGVGMSQWGANAMAKNGNDYKEILKHYYSGIDIEKIKKD